MWHRLQNVFDDEALKQLANEDEDASRLVQAVLWDAAQQFNKKTEEGLEACYEAVLGLCRKGILIIEINDEGDGDYRLYKNGTVPSNGV